MHSSPWLRTGHACTIPIIPSSSWFSFSVCLAHSHAQHKRTNARTRTLSGKQYQALNAPVRIIVKQLTDATLLVLVTSGPVTLPQDPWSASCGVSSYCDKERFGLPRPRSSGVRPRYFISLPPYQRNQHQDLFILRHPIRLIQRVFQLWQEEIMDFPNHGLPGSSPDVSSRFLLPNCTHVQSPPLSKHSIHFIHSIFLLWPRDFRTQVPPETTFNASLRLSFSSATRINYCTRPRGPSSPQAPLCMASRLD